MFDQDPLIPRERPCYAEAYPRLDFVAAQREISAGRTLCLFERTRRGQVGAFEFVCYGQEANGLRFLRGVASFTPDFHQLGSYGQDLTFWLEPLAIGVEHWRDYAKCPECRNRKGVLIYAQGAWRCRQCHGLLTRSQLIDPGVRLREKIAKLDAHIGRGRPKGMHHVTFQKLRDHHGELVARAAGLGIDPNRCASIDHDRVVTARWIAQDELGDFLRPELARSTLTASSR